ncbi:MAG TPA: O-antigen ligase family protein, partial [Thermoanaerobaculia bacterium]|nr:O-antigen ligase family protein [Thermoanaerobaculia bacterium]
MTETVEVPQTLTVERPAAAERLALRIMQTGAVAVVLVVTTLNVFELDRFFVPKELALHVTAFLAALLAFRAVLRIAITRIDLFLAAYLVLGIVSAVFATNRWVALRSLAITASGLAIFWTARALRDRGLSRPLINGLALAIVVVAATCLLQTYGLDLALFSENRVPGGTLGNRNFIAHAGAFGFPVVLLAVLFARHERMSITSSLGVTIVTASLVVTRSRAAWLAFAAMLLVFILAMFVSAPLRRDRHMWGRLGVTLVLVASGVAAALFIPNSLHWVSDNPYAETLKNVAEYQRGSGRGRLVQYERSLIMTVTHPLFGVGPGNWAVRYPHYAGRRDPSMNENEPGMTMNPWPSSDWVAILSERGPAAFVLLALAMLGIATSGLRR